MKNLFHITILTFLSLFFVNNHLYGQLYEISLDRRIRESRLIIEGKVIESKSYSIDGTIYTANKIQILGVLKGSYKNKYLTITTWGGELDGEIQTWTHLLTLGEGNYGLFFLNPTQVPVISDIDYFESFDVYSGLQGFVAFTQNEAKAWIGSDFFRTYLDIPNELYYYIEKKVGQKPVYANKKDGQKKSGIRFYFTDILINGNSISFNIYVNSLLGTKKIYKSGIQLGYNSAFFGSNIATNGNLSMQEVGISLSNSYNLVQQNISQNEFKIGLISVGTASNLSQINTTEQLLANGVITIQNILEDPAITYDIQAMQSMSKFFENGAIHQFDTVIIDGDWKLSQKTVIIDSIFPLVVAGGIGQEITIKGSGFGESPDGVLPPVSKRVVFTPAPEVFPPSYYWAVPIKSPTQYSEWKDTIIRIKVPSVARDLDNPAYLGGLIDAAACSEIIGILDLTAGPVIQSEQSLYVKYSAQNQAYLFSENEHVAKVKLANQNGEGGYDLYYSSAFDTLNGGNAIQAFERALTTWRCNTRVNFNVKDYTSTPPLNACKIDYGVLPVGTSTSTRAAYAILGLIENCGADTATIFHYLTKFDLVFSNSYMWHTETNTPSLDWLNHVDLETIALHELGHAHLLLHTNNSSNVMYGLTNVYKRALTDDDIEGGSYIVGYSSSNDQSPCTSYLHMTQISQEDCVLTTNVNDIQNLANRFLITPNPNSGNFRISLKEDLLSFNPKKIEVYNITGQLVYSKETFSIGIEEIEIQNIESGIYFVTIYEGNNIFSGKFIKQ